MHTIIGYSGPSLIWTQRDQTMATYVSEITRYVNHHGNSMYSVSLWQYCTFFHVIVSANNHHTYVGLSGLQTVEVPESLCGCYSLLV